MDLLSAYLLFILCDIWTFICSTHALFLTSFPAVFFELFIRVLWTFLLGYFWEFLCVGACTLYRYVTGRLPYRSMTRLVLTQNRCCDGPCVRKLWRWRGE